MGTLLEHQVAIFHKNTCCGLLNRSVLARHFLEMSTHNMFFFFLFFFLRNKKKNIFKLSTLILFLNRTITFTTLWANSADFMIFFLIFPENRIRQETICMKCQILFPGKNKKNISKCRLLCINSSSAIHCSR